MTQTFISPATTSRENQAAYQRYQRDLVPAGFFAEPKTHAELAAYLFRLRGDKDEVTKKRGGFVEAPLQTPGAFVKYPATLLGKEGVAFDLLTALWKLNQRESKNLSGVVEYDLDGILELMGYQKRGGYFRSEDRQRVWDVMRALHETEVSYTFTRRLEGIDSKETHLEKQFEQFHYFKIRRLRTRGGDEVKDMKFIQDVKKPHKIIALEWDWALVSQVYEMTTKVSDKEVKPELTPTYLLDSVSEGSAAIKRYHRFLATRANEDGRYAAAFEEHLRGAGLEDLAESNFTTAKRRFVEDLRGACENNSIKAFGWPIGDEWLWYGHHDNFANSEHLRALQRDTKFEVERVTPETND